MSAVSCVLILDGKVEVEYDCNKVALALAVLNSPNTPTMLNPIAEKANLSSQVVQEQASGVPTMQDHTEDQQNMNTTPHQPCLSSLDGIRGVCSLFIVVGHVLTFWAPQEPAISGELLINGTILKDWPRFGLDYLSPVTLFFIISGFTLVCVYDDNHHDPQSAIPLCTWNAKKEFFLKRAARLGPLYYMGLAVGIAPLIVYEDSLTVAISIPVALCWLQSIATVGTAWNAPLWNASAFAFCYLFFPTMLRFRDLSKSNLIWAIAGCTLFSWTCVLIVGVFAKEFGILHIFAPFRLSQFSVGVFAGLLAKKCRISRPTALTETCSVVLVSSIVLCAIIGTGNIIGWILYAHLAEFVLPPIHAMWILGLTTPGCCGPTRATLESWPLRILGQWSYALYCLHFPIISWCCWAVAGRGVAMNAVPGFNTSGFTFYFNLPTWAVIPILAICLAIAGAAHHLIEEPARRYLTKRGSALAAASLADIKRSEPTQSSAPAGA